MCSSDLAVRFVPAYARVERREAFPSRAGATAEMRVTEARKARWQNGVIRNIDWNDIKRTHANDDFLFAQQYVIVSCMEKTILIAGKDLPYGGDFADGMALAGYNVVVTGNPESDGAAVTAGDIVIASWNKPSSVSARSLVLQAENAFTVIDETMLYFDAAVYALIDRKSVVRERV